MQTNGLFNISYLHCGLFRGVASALNVNQDIQDLRNDIRYDSPQVSSYVSCLVESIFTPT